MLAEHFACLGNAVYVVNRGNFRKAYPSGIRHLIADRNDSSQLTKALSEHSFDVVIDNNAYTADHITTFFQALGDGKAGRCRHYIFTSTAAVYMRLASRQRLKEEDVPMGPIAPGDLREQDDTGRNSTYSPWIRPYALGKLEAEASVKEIADRTGIHYTIMRLPNVFGEGDFSGKLSYFLYRLQDGGEILLEEEIDKFSLIHVKDAVKVFAAVAGNDKCFGRTLNAADSNLYDYHDFFLAVYLDKEVQKRLVLVPAREIWNAGYQIPFAWGPPLNISLLESLIGKTSFIPPAAWGRETLRWEKDHLAGNISARRYQEMRNHEFEIIRTLTSGHLQDKIDASHQHQQ